MSLGANSNVCDSSESVDHVSLPLMPLIFDWMPNIVNFVLDISTVL